jgi:hypothetical protein
MQCYLLLLRSTPTTPMPYSTGIAIERLQSRGKVGLYFKPNLLPLLLQPHLLFVLASVIVCFISYSTPARTTGIDCQALTPLQRTAQWQHAAAEDTANAGSDRSTHLNITVKTHTPHLHQRSKYKLLVIVTPQNTKCTLARICFTVFFYVGSIATISLINEPVCICFY